jgi:hypothetical protein
LPLGAGINALVALHAERVVELAVAEPGAVADMDTPEDYERWAERSAERPKPSHGAPECL